MTNLHAFISVSAVIGAVFLVVGVIAVMSGGGTMEQVIALGQTLVIAGAIILAGVVISVAVANNGGKR